MSKQFLIPFQKTLNDYLKSAETWTDLPIVAKHGDVEVSYLSSIETIMHRGFGSIKICILFSRNINLCLYTRPLKYDNVTRSIEVPDIIVYEGFLEIVNVNTHCFKFQRLPYNWTGLSTIISDFLYKRYVEEMSRPISELKINVIRELTYLTLGLKPPLPL